MKTLFAFVLLSSSLSSVLAVIIVQEKLAHHPRQRQATGEGIPTLRPSPPHEVKAMALTGTHATMGVLEAEVNVILLGPDHIANFPYPCIICAYTICTGCT
ncbi:uncharacterized protein [Heptranchias perlo]|uniref:uncharacterized protein isoform X2 n=1 Tax=Heptranchias perlo TaxID=212740 RepID=UPI00355A7529